MKTIEAYRPESVIIYIVIVVLLAMILAGLVAAAVIQFNSGITGVDLALPYTIALAIILAPTIWLGRYPFRRWRLNHDMKKAFLERGKTVEAKIVGKEERELGESTEHFVIYQFAPDFKVIAQDNTWELVYWKKNIGESITVKTLLDSPTTTTIELL